MGVLSTVFDFLHGLGVGALVVALHSELVRRLPEGRHLAQVGSGLVFGLGAVLAMAQPVIVMEGIVVDARNVLVALSGAMIGPVGAAATLAPTLLFRMWTGGIGAATGCLGLLIAGAVGISFGLASRRGRRELGFREFLALGLAANLSLVSLVMLPPEILPKMVVPSILCALATTLGVVIFGLLLTRERRRVTAEDETLRLAATDHLTGLANRRNLEAELATLWSSPARDAALLLIDVDHFKSINDRHGHDVGDAALIAVAECLKGLAGPHGVAARLGGDEFALLLPGRSGDAAAGVARRLAAALAQVSREVGLPLTATAGIARREPAMTRPSDLLKAADVMLYAGKQARSRGPAELARAA